MSLKFSNNLDMLTGTTPASSSVGVTATTTGRAIDVSMRSQIVVQFRSVDNAGSGAFSIDGSNDGTNWVTGLACQDLTATASGTYVTSKTLSSATSAAVKVTAGFAYIRCVCTVTTGGTYFADLESAG